MARGGAVDIEKPIFFIGMPRSGTTVTFEVFAAHRELGWLSNYSRRLPQFPYVTVVHRLFGDRRGRKSQDQTISFVRRLLPEPMEDYAIWNSFFGESFSRSFLKGHTPQSDQIRACRAYMGKILLAESKSRLCVKFTGPPRKRFLEHVFPDAYFINVVRDPRAVVASLLTVYFWKQRGLTQPYWEGGLSCEELDVWERYSRSPVALAALQWCAVWRATQEESVHSPNPTASITYESFMRDPRSEIRRLAAFCNLQDTPAVDRYIQSQQYRDMNSKYKEILSPADIEVVEKITAPYSHAYGYV
jgi:hypothetical protein